MNWFKRHIPTRESIQRHRLLKPFARQLSQPELWHMTNRSVPRAVALGLGIGVIIPFFHTVIAAILAIPLRANVAIAAAFTLIVNPLTIPAIYYAAYRLGSWELHHDASLINPTTAVRVSGELGRFLFWIHEASGPIALGILTIAVAAAAFGYLAAALLWHSWIGSRWRERQEERLR